MKYLSINTENLLQQILECVRYKGYCLVHDVFSRPQVEEMRSAMYEAYDVILQTIGKKRLQRAKELGVVRLMMRHHPLFFKLLETPLFLDIIDNTVGKSAIMHLQNGFILPPIPLEETPRFFQNSFHMDFKRVINRYLLSINTFICVSDFTVENGCTLVVPGSHQQSQVPSEDYMKKNAVAVEAPAGSVIVFDSTLWHSAGINQSSKDRLGINHQFTKSWIKQQIDYVRGLEEEVILAQKPRTQQLLGYYTRVVTSLEEFYVPEEERLYCAYQG